jgi:hypothetical protein
MGDSIYVKERAHNWTNKITEESLRSLTKLQKPFKYIGEKNDLGVDYTFVLDVQFGCAFHC